MTVTKQQQLEWLAKHIEKWKSGYTYAVVEEATDGRLYVRWPTICTSGITKKEWRQERDRMSSKPEIDNSWHERGELPPVGCECEFCNSDDEWDDWLRSVFVGFDSTGNGVVSVFGDDKGVLWISSNPDDFRPLRTEREKAIDEMANLIAKSVFGSAKCQAEKLYDAGYRKINP